MSGIRDGGGARPATGAQLAALSVLAVWLLACGSTPRPGERVLGPRPVVEPTVVRPEAPEHGPPGVPLGQRPPASAGAEEQALSGERLAVIVGVSRYEQRAIPQLAYADADAETLYSFLVEETGGGFRRSNVQLLTNEQATRQAILQAIEAANQAAAQPVDLLLLYFAGHGTVEVGERGELLGNYLVPYDAHTRGEGEQLRIVPQTGIAVSELQELLGRNRARNLLLVLDTCFAGGARSLSRGTLTAQQAAVSEEQFRELTDAAVGRAVLTATAPNQPALEIGGLGPGRGQGLFTWALLKAFEHDDNRDDQVTLREVHEYVSRVVTERARALGHQQTPLLKANLAGSMVLRVLPPRLQVGLRVRYGEAEQPLAATARLPARPHLVRDPRSYQLEVDTWAQGAPLHVYVLRLVRPEAASARARWERLLPDGWNALAPPVTVAAGRPAVYPVEAETGWRQAPVPAAEREALVLFVLVAARERLDRVHLDGVAEAAAAALGGAGEAHEPEAAARAARRAAAVFERDDELKPAALLYLLVRHEGDGNLEKTR
ncbi:MAG: hypothetical protein KatS3mg102_0896 [Planctomycetota bacterium]|nr:MAG: hypothetical protein KatS3mg102_0896 [Planctomycetota bacterium]